MMFQSSLLIQHSNCFQKYLVYVKINIQFIMFNISIFQCKRAILVLKSEKNINNLISISQNKKLMDE